MYGTPCLHNIRTPLQDSGFRARCAREVVDGGQVRLEKIMNIVSESRYGVHDISRTALDQHNALPRFNMPLELGIDLGCKRFGVGRHRSKVFLIMDSDRFRYQKFISDIAGQDIHSHTGDPKQAGRGVRDWLNANSGGTNIPSGSKIYERYESFRQDIPALCNDAQFDIKELTFLDLSFLIAEWLKAHGRF